jgi:circadian clock protein KaiC
VLKCLPIERQFAAAKNSGGNVTADHDLVKTGIQGLDSILNGGIPRGNLILVEGAIGTGKTTLGVEVVYRGVTQFGEPGLIVLFEVTPDRIVRDAERMGWDLRALEQAGTLKFVFTTRQVFAQEMQQLDSMLLDEAARMGARRIFVDGMAGARGPDAAVEARDSFHILADGLQRVNLTAVLSVEATAFSERRQMALPEESIADTVIRLRMEEVTRSIVRSIEVVKSRGHEFQLGRHSLRIVDGKGIEVYRRVQAPRVGRDRAAAFDLTKRVTTGVPGLDSLMNGGYLLGSTTVIAGISGVGKSVMGLQYMAEGARCGERSLMFSLDEQVPQVIRNANSIGIDLQHLIDEGLVRVQYDTPQEIEIDHHFHDLEEVVADFKPTRVLFDSLSTYGSNLGTTGRMFRDFFHALVALMKEHQTATVYNHENPEMLGMGSMMGEFAMSSLVDNIVLMNWVELGDAFRLALTVAKMRANPNTRATHECEIVDQQGMRVLPRTVPPTMVRPFSAYLGLISRNAARHPDSAVP